MTNIAKEFFDSLKIKESRDKLFELYDEEQLLEIKKHIDQEKKQRNQKCYYRFENPLTNEIEWCVEAKLGLHLKSDSFKHTLKMLGRNRRANRNKNKEIYSITKAQKPYKTSKELEDIFESDLEHGRAAQSQIIEGLGSRPTKLTELQC